MLQGADFKHTLIASLQPCVDGIRNIATQLGARPYQVALVWTRWSAGTRGEGVEEVVREELLLPTPKVVDLSTLGRDLQPVGLDEVGSVRVTEISARYTEDYLVGVCDNGQPEEPDQSFYWEVRFPRADGQGPRRRFRAASAPTLEPTKFQWTIRLLKISEDRQRDGEVRG